MIMIHFQPIDVERLKRAINTYVETEKRKLGFELKWNSLRQLRLFLIGIAFLALWLYASSITEGIWRIIVHYRLFCRMGSNQYLGDR